MYLAEDDLSNVLDLIVLMQLMDVSRNPFARRSHTPISTYPSKSNAINKVRCIVPVQLMKHRNRERLFVVSRMGGSKKKGGGARMRKSRGEQGKWRKGRKKDIY